MKPELPLSWPPPRRRRSSRDSGSAEERVPPDERARCPTLGDLIEAVANETADLTELAAVVDHILRTRTRRRIAPAEVGE